MIREPSPTFAAILADRVSGSRMLAHASMRAIWWALQQGRTGDVEAFLGQVESTFPSMAVLLNMVAAFREGGVNEQTWQSVHTRLQDTSWLERALHLLPATPHTVVTFSHSGAVLALLQAAGQRGAGVQCCRSLPGAEGEAMCRALLGMGLQARVIEDAQAAQALQGAGVCFIGADMTADKYIVNKVGSLALALACHHHNVPMLALAGPMKSLHGAAYERYRLGPLYEQVPTALVQVVE